MVYRKDLHILLEPAVKAVDYELLGCEFISQGKHSILRVYIDNTPGITINDCEIASRQISAMLDVEDPIKGEYSLEVSSPGLERPLFTAEQYRQAQGQQVVMNLRTPLAGRRKLRGTIAEINDENIVLNTAENELIVPLDAIARAHLIDTKDRDK